jgi:hypothetical protein
MKRSTSGVRKGVQVTPELEARFWSKVKKTRGCWNWTAGLYSAGYGSIHLGRTNGAHRVSWELHFGPIPPGLCVLHRCDNPLCVRPDHLFLGTQADNIADMAEKGRHGHAKLDTEKVRAIRILAADGYTQTDLGLYFGVHRTVVGDIVHGETWKHVRRAS